MSVSPSNLSWENGPSWTEGPVGLANSRGKPGLGVERFVLMLEACGRRLAVASARGGPTGL